MILVTGANGLVGSFICRKLLEKKVSFKALKRQGSDLKLLDDLQEKIYWIEGDVLDLMSLSKALEDVDTVIHTAAVVSYSKKDKELMHKVNVEGTANVVNLCLKKKVLKLVHVSSVAALGRKKDEKLIAENAKWDNNEFTTNYAMSKYLSELEVWRGQMEGLQTVIVNPSLVIGPGDIEKSSTRIFKYIYDEKKYFTEGSVNYIDVRDVAEAIWLLMLHEISGERYILNAGTVSYKELFEMISFYLNKKSPSIKVNEKLLGIAYFLEQTRSFITRKEPLITKEILYLSKNQYVYDSTKIKNKVGINFHDLDETIEWSCKELARKLKKT